ncbi:MAG: hypothetical protein PHS62_02645 [Patescibacteria group bacterium]|nr:hypothetical protein [Patescibacteria group bacterium]
MKKILKHVLVFVCLMALLVLPSLVLAASSASDSLNKVGAGLSNAPYQNITTGSNDLAGIVGIIIQAFLGLLGVLFLVYIIYAGYNWMVAQGDEEKVTKAKDTIQRAVIGLIVTIGAYAISYWVFGSLLAGTNIMK